MLFIKKEKFFGSFNDNNLFKSSFNLFDVKFKGI